MNLPESLKSRLKNADQTHLLNGWDGLNETEQQAFLAQLESIDFDQLQKYATDQEATGGDDLFERACNAQPPAELIGNDSPPAGSPERIAAIELGESLLRDGRVGAIVVAGGQGTRLGFPHPKGLFPIGPVSGEVLFQFLCGQIVALSKKYGATIPYYVMTSNATHDEVVAGFENRNYFGLDPQDVKFFKQGHMPAVDAESGKLLLSSAGSLALSPDGHGGMLAALASQGLLTDMRERGLEQIYYHQVDNPCLKICDPEFLGFHVSSGSEMSTKVVRKIAAEEKMGLLVDLDGKTQIIEYSDIPDEVAAKTNPDGSLLLWAGNTACHAFSLAFLERLAATEDSLPIHRAHKKVPFLNEQGNLVEPEEPNAFKFERFIFDALPQAQVALVIETSRAREFNPVKNATGADSPETSQTALQAIWKRWLRDAGVTVADEAVVEIQPSFALDAQDVKRRKDEIPTATTEQLLLK